MNRNLLIFALILIILVVVAFFTLSSTQILGSTKDVTINGQTFQTEIADNEKEHEIGLANRKSLDEKKGLLFLFPRADRYHFWMMNMQFPIDMIFINGNRIVTIHHSVPAFLEGQGDKKQNLQRYQPTEPADKVLEINAGLAKKYDIKVGDTITIEE